MEVWHFGSYEPSSLLVIGYTHFRMNDVSGTFQYYCLFNWIMNVYLQWLAFYLYVS